jgi:hypothetical protein
MRQVIGVSDGQVSTPACPARHLRAEGQGGGSHLTLGKRAAQRDPTGRTRELPHALSFLPPLGPLCWPNLLRSHRLRELTGHIQFCLGEQASEEQ